MKTIKEYLDSLDLEASFKTNKTSYLGKIEKFCNKNKNKLSNLPSTGQLEQMKLKKEPEELIGYILKQSEKSTNKKWRTSVKYVDQNQKDIMFYEFLIKKIFDLSESEKDKDTEKFKLKVKYFIEYLVDYIKMNRR